MLIWITTVLLWLLQLLNGASPCRAVINHETSFFYGYQVGDCCKNRNREALPVPGKDFDVVEIEIARHDSNLLEASSDDRLFQSSDGGDTWKETTLEEIEKILDPYSYGPHPSNPLVVYRFVEPLEPPWNPYLQRSNDGGRTWVRTSCLIKGTDKSAHIGHIHYHPADPDTVYAYAGLADASDAFNGYYMSHDGGQTFAFILSTNFATSYNFTISKSHPNVIYAVGLHGSLVKTVDGGSTWRPVGNNDLTKMIRQIVLDPVNPDIVYVVSGIASVKGVMKSADGGNSWCLLDMGDKLNASVGSLALSPRDRNVFLVGTRRGLYRSKNDGCEWEKIAILDRLRK